MENESASTVQNQICRRKPSPQKSTVAVNTLSVSKMEQKSLAFLFLSVGRRSRAPEDETPAADELLLDCLEHSSSSANSEFHRLLLDCNETEQTVIIRMAKELKATLVSLGV